MKKLAEKDGFSICLIEDSDVSKGMDVEASELPEISEDMKACRQIRASMKAAGKSSMEISKAINAHFEKARRRHYDEVINGMREALS